MNDLHERLLTAIIGIGILVLVILKGGFLLATAIFLMSLIGVREFYRAVETIDLNPVKLVGYLATAGIYLANLSNENPENLMVFILTSSIILALLIFVFGEERKIEDIAITFLGIIYIPYMLNHIFLLDGTKYIWLVFIIPFGSDTFAYFVGNLFGKHKLSPNISPNKSVEGAVGGIVGSMLLTFIYSKYMNIEAIGRLVLLAGLGSIIAQTGDLVASKIKRQTGIKDFGNLLPGHGGVLDRFDSVILSSPVIYYYIKFLI